MILVKLSKHAKNRMFLLGGVIIPKDADIFWKYIKYIYMKIHKTKFKKHIKIIIYGYKYV